MANNSKTVKVPQKFTERFLSISFKICFGARVAFLTKLKIVTKMTLQLNIFLSASIPARQRQH